MNSLPIIVLALYYAAVGQTHLPNPGPVNVAVTQTTATLSWDPVPGATFYRVWREMLDGTYGQRWEVFATVTQPTVEFTELQPGTRKQVQITTEDNPGLQGGGAQMSFRTLLSPVWRSGPVSTFDRGAIYSVMLDYDGEPRPQLSFLEAPAGMFFEYARGGVQTGRIIWNGDASQPVNLTLKLENSLGEVANLSTVLTPSNAPPTDPPLIPKQVIARFDAQPIASVLGFIPDQARLHVKLPGSPLFIPRGNMTLLSEGVYAGQAASVTGENVFQVRVRDAVTKSFIWSNPVPMPPTAPSDIRLSADSNSIEVSWQDNATNESIFEVFRSVNGPDGSFTLIASTAADVSTWSDLQPDPLTEYCYKVRALALFGGVTSNSEFSSTACASTLPLPPPPAPPGLHVTARTTGVDLDPDGYGVAIWSVEGSARTLIATGIMPANGTVTFDLSAAHYDVEFDAILGHNEVALNCEPISPPSQRIALVGSAEATFEVVCTPVTQIAFVSTIDGNPEIYAINSDGTGRVRLTVESTSDVEPSWSPDGRKIAFVSERDGDPEIYVMNADGSSPTRLTNWTSRESHPTWSPDGTRLAFVSDRDGSADIYQMNADGTGLVNLTAHPADDRDPAWSPDGARIAFSSNRDDASFPGLYLMNVDGTNVTRLTTDLAVADTQPAWSPDGSTFAISRGQSNPAGSGVDFLFEMDPASGVAFSRAAPSRCESYRDPTWSPNALNIAFTIYDACSGSGSTIRVLRGWGVLQRLTDDGFNPSWRR